MLLTEAIARFGLGLGQAPLSIAHPTIEYLFKPEQSVRPFHNHLHINQFSMRSPEFSRRKSDVNEYRVLVFGDSVISGGNQLDDSELATEILRRRLVTTMAQPVVVGNISAGSWGSPNMLAYAREFGLFDADLVLIVLSSHDSCDVPTFGPLDPNTHPTHAPMSALFEAVTRYLPRYLPSFGTGTDQPLSVPACDGVDLQTSLDALSAALRLFKTQTPHVLLILHSTQSELSKRANQTGNHLLAELAHREKVPVFQLGARFSSAIAAGDNPYRDDIHLSATGQRLLADVMYEQVDQIAAPTNENR